MPDLVILHNPNCSSSRYATELADELGVSYSIRRYLLKAERLDRAELETLVAQLDDPATDLVRRDANFDKLGLSDGDVATAAQVVDVLEKNFALLQRPVLIKGDRAIIGRPRERVRPFIRP